MLTAVIVIVVFSVLILVHEAGHLIAAKKAGIGVKVFSLGFGKRLWGKELGGTDYRISLLPFGGYIKMAGEDPTEATGRKDELYSKPPGSRFWVMVAGALTNYVFAFILFSIIFMIGVPTLTNEIGQVLNGYPAQEAGIQMGDKILSINEKEIKYWDDVIDSIKKESAGGAALNVELERRKRVFSIKVKPQIYTVTNIFGQTISRPMLGIAPVNRVLPVRYDPFRAVYHGGKRLLVLTGMTYKGIWLLLTGGLPVKKSVTGPVGIIHLIGQAANLGVVPLMIITAHVSMALAIFNLLPFPPLDGGHVIFLGLEKLRGRPISHKVQENITNVAFLILIAFVLFVTWQDILKFTPLGKK
ncbi:MAG: site-2 protease family protein [Candidatus Omnitrophota bacterium]